VENDVNQTIAELIAANAVSEMKPVAILTDFKTFEFFWIGQVEDSSISVSNANFRVYGTKFEDVHQAASFTRMLLNPQRRTLKIVSLSMIRG